MVNISEINKMQFFKFKMESSELINVLVVHNLEAHMVWYVTYIQKVNNVNALLQILDILILLYIDIYK